MLEIILVYAEGEQRFANSPAGKARYTANPDLRLQ